MLNWLSFGNKNKEQEKNEQICLNETGDFYINNLESLDLQAKSRNYDYYYPIDVLDCKDLVPQQRLNIIIYNINKSLTQPFIEFLLFKNSLFYNFILMNFNGDFDSLMKELDTYLNNYLNCSFNIINKGYVIYNSNNYLICEIDFKEYNIVLDSNKQYEFATIHDILNVHFIYDVFINENVEKFLTNNKSFLFLYKNVSDLKEFIPNPIIMYGLVNKNDEKFHLKRGREVEYGQFGKGYYFNNFANCYTKKNNNNIIYKYVIQPNNIKYIFHSDSFKLYKDSWQNHYDSVLININQQQLVIKDKKNHIVKGMFC
jgi:hypothetical protein